MSPQLLFRTIQYNSNKLKIFGVSGKGESRSKLSANPILKSLCHYCSDKIFSAMQCQYFYIILISPNIFFHNSLLSFAEIAAQWVDHLIYIKKTGYSFSYTIHIPACQKAGRSFVIDIYLYLTSVYN